VVRLGIVGAGIMGTSHARVARAIPDARVALVADTDANRGQRLAAHVGASYAASADELPGRVDAAIIAAPTDAHPSIATMLMENGIDVLVEKPMAPTVEEAASVVAVAEKYDRILMAGHIERFNPAVLELGRYVNGLIHIDIRRVGPFSPRVTTSVILDLMIHDIDLVHMLAGSELKEVLALARRVRSATEDLATCLLTFANGVSATLTASRVGQAKHRQIELTQQDNVVIADLIRQQLTVHRVAHSEFVDDRGARYQQSGVVEIPYLEHQGEPLALELRHFIDCVLSHSQPVVSGHAGLAALETALRIRSEAIRLG
jgi:UDP-N-acetylglucosamine 3-dehydrogenase